MSPFLDPESRLDKPERASVPLHFYEDPSHPYGSPRCRIGPITQETSMIPPRVNIDIVRERIGPYAEQDQTQQERFAIYEELIGFVPPRIEARINVTGALDPKLLELQERMREQAMYPKCFDVKTSQLMLFGMLMMDLNDAAPLHAIAARRAGATWEELQATISLAFLFRGLSAANRGAEILANIAKREADAEAASKSGA